MKISGCAVFLLLAIVGSRTVHGQEAASSEETTPEDESWRDQIPGDLRYWARVRARAERFSLPHGASSADSRYGFQHVRTRLGAEWRNEQVAVGLEVQHVQVFGAPRNAVGGPGAAYFAANGERSPEHINVRQLFGEVSLSSEASFRVGRLVIIDGSGPVYGDRAFQFVRDRGNNRLVGIRDWPGGGRTLDGVSFRHETDISHFHAYGAEVNKHAFAVEETGNSLDDTRVAGMELVFLRGTPIPFTELRAFAMSFRDGRTLVESTLGDEIDIVTAGLQLATMVEVGEGTWDGYFWWATQSGDFGSASHRSAAWVLETGYRFAECTWKPWIRIGHARAQGDGDPTDSKNQNFYNGFPAIHPNHGQLDLFSFSNLRDTYAEIRLEPHAKVDTSLRFHLFDLASSSAPSFGGAGAFDDDSLGFASRPIPGGRRLGQEIDWFLRIRAIDSVTVSFGYSHFWGGTVFRRLFSQDDAAFGYAQVTLNF